MLVDLHYTYRYQIPPGISDTGGISREANPNRRVHAGVALIAAAAPAAAAPAAGNGGKFVFEIDEEGTVDCDGTEVNVHWEGWAQGKTFTGKGNRNLELTVFHLKGTFTSENGTFTYLDVGPDHFYMDQNGDLYFAITGRPSDPVGEGFSLTGHLVIDLAAGTYEIHGNVSPTPEDRSCDVLTT